MAAEVFSINALMEWNNNKISDHNRQPLSVTIERIESSKRMANATMRKYVIADKRSFGTSWEMLPNKSADTVDGFWGADEMEAFFNNNAGAFTLKVTYSNRVTESFTVVFKSFSKTLSKRGVYDFWNVDVEMEEV